MTAPVWSEAALALFDLAGPTAVSAGAGSGKTTCLVELCLRLLSGEALGTPCDPSEIVAITFTEKAALELEERLRAAIAARAAAAPVGSDEARRWRQQADGLERMAVGTIHGFTRRLLAEHALEAGLDPAFEVLDDETARAWLGEAALAAVIAALDAGRPEALRLCAAHGPGGRRAGLADVLCDLARERASVGDASPPRPALDGGAAAEAARREALAAAASALGLRPRVRTASGAQALERLAARRAALEEADREGAIRPEALAAFAGMAAAVRGWRVGASDGPGAREARDALVSACERFALCAAEALSGPQRTELCALLADAEARYAARKRRARALDFDDLLARARDLLRDDPALRSELRSRIRALLVDEYQDVNALQQELFELLAGGEGGPLLVAVGDAKQSIYRFRGADVSVFRGVIERFAVPPGRVLHLADNHRSTPEVLALVNETFARCMQPAGPGSRRYELAFGDRDRLVPRRPSPGASRAPACEILEDGGGGRAAERRIREARAVADRIAALVSGVAGVVVPDRNGADAPLRTPRHRDIAVLFRRLTEVGEYERALRAAGIPYRLARGGAFYRQPEVRDCGELLAAVADPGDRLAWAALLRSPLCGVAEGTAFALARLGFGLLAREPPEAVVAALCARYQGASAPAPWDFAAGGLSSDAERLARFLRVWRGLRDDRDRVPPHVLLGRAVDELDLEAAHLAAPDGERRASNLRKAMLVVERWGEAGMGAAAAAARLRALAARPPREPEAELEAADAVALLSVHQAKGLEWPVVFVPDLGAGALPDGRRVLRAPGGLVAASFFDERLDVHHRTSSVEAARAEERRAAAAESRRLLYVALTRARDRLVLSGEAGRGGESWRALVEAGVAAVPDLVMRIPIDAASSFRSGPAPTGSVEAAAPAPDSSAAREAGAHPERAGGARGTSAAAPRPPVVVGPAPGGARADLSPPRLPVAAGPAPMRFAVTELAEHARCPRRVLLARHLGLAERPAASSPAQDDPDRATARGTLAHAMLAEADLAAPPLDRRAQLVAAAVRRGHDARSPGVRRILADVWRFLEAEPGRALCAAAREGRLRRELPFLLRADGDGLPACYLVGAIDALVESRREVAVVDFKYALCSRGAAERYRWQLVAYALAAARALPGRRVTARVQFIRGPCAAIDVTPGDGELRRFARELPRLAAAAASGAGLTRSAAELGRGIERCRAEGCGFVARCHGPGGDAGAAAELARSPPARTRVRAAVRT